MNNIAGILLTRHQILKYLFYMCKYFRQNFVILKNWIEVHPSLSLINGSQSSNFLDFTRECFTFLWRRTRLLLFWEQTRVSNCWRIEYSRFILLIVADSSYFHPGQETWRFYKYLFTSSIPYMDIKFRYIFSRDFDQAFQLF